MPDGAVTSCGICGATELIPVLDLGEQPLAEGVAAKRVYPLRVVQCAECNLAQLDYVVDRAEVFPAGHPYSSGNSMALRRHFALLAEKLGTGLTPASRDGAPGDLVVDIGANDGTLLYAFGRFGLRRIAIEPTNQINKVRLTDTYAPGVKLYQSFFGFELAHRILAEQGPAKVITATNVLAHVADPHDFVAGVKTLLANDGVFVTENHDWLSVARGLQIDTVYHEHLRFFTVGTLARLLGNHGLVIADVERIGTHGGSFRVCAVKDPAPGLNLRAHAVLDCLHALVRVCSANGPLYGVGASTRAAPLIHAAGIADYIDCVCEVPASDKIGTLIPGTQIPVTCEGWEFDSPAYALLFAWHLAADIIPKMRQQGYDGKFIIPLPEPRVIDG